MSQRNRYKSILLNLFVLLATVYQSKAQSNSQLIQLNTDEEYQQITGFGASLSFYENWLTAHPNKAEIYDVIFKELSLDILRVRNAYDYDAGMVDRVKEFVDAANVSLGHPIQLLVTSWGPPAYLKSNNDRSNGGTLKYTGSGSSISFDYEGFASWWNKSLDDYNAKGIFPSYISIQNEPDFSATWESCLLQPTQNNSQKIAGYNKALDAFYDSVSVRENAPKFIGPECIGIGYNAVENYINALDLSKLHAISHHLYHGAEGGNVADDPFTSDAYTKLGKFHPEVPHFQTEYSRADWFPLAGMIFQSLATESVSAFLYWDLIWSGSGLVNLHFPWDPSQWTNDKGYNRNKDFYVFKHYSAYIHPGWTRIGTSGTGYFLKSTAFISPAKDSATVILINRSETESMEVQLSLPGTTVYESHVFTTSEEESFSTTAFLNDTSFHIPPQSLSTVQLILSPLNSLAESHFLQNEQLDIYPNPVSFSTRINFFSNKSSEFELSVFDVSGKQLTKQPKGFFPAGDNSFFFYRDQLKSGIYFLKLQANNGQTFRGKMVVTD
ncbi:T9SS type A sorting domain-containing protein [Maribellus mangrovi]|uniref:T9SS type A sorting domain-containing protein n=1 Tax=Maribellus mangrovi TaxID=3133146 RepID=UPI0030EF0810